MYAGVIASVIGHVLLVLVLAVGLPELFPPQDKIITTNSLGVITEDQLAALSEPKLPPAREAGSSTANTAAVASAANATISKQTAEAAQSGANTAALTAADAARPARTPDAAQSAADAASSAAVQTANAASAQTAQSAATATAASAAAQNAQQSSTREAKTQTAAVRPLTPAKLAANAPPPPKATASAHRLPPRRPIESAATSTAPPSLTASQPQADAATRGPTELAAARPPELSAAKPPEATPATPPKNPDEPHPREALVQTAVLRAEARRTRLPPRRPDHLDDSPDEVPNTGTRQVAEAPQKATGRKPAKQDFFASMKSSIGAKPTAGGLDGVRQTLGVGIAGARVSASDQAALAKRLGGCWYKPDGQRNARDLIVELAVELDTSSNLEGTPRILKKPPASAGAPGRVAVDRAIQAVRKCAPFNANGLVLPPNSYPDWRTMRITFDPS